LSYERVRTEMRLLSLAHIAGLPKIAD